MSWEGTFPDSATRWSVRCRYGSRKKRCCSMVTGSLVGGYLIDIDAALPFYLGAALSALGCLGAWSLCRLLDNAGK